MINRNFERLNESYVRKLFVAIASQYIGGHRKCQISLSSAASSYGQKGLDITAILGLIKSFGDTCLSQLKENGSKNYRININMQAEALIK